MAKATLPEFKLPELKLPKIDLDALFGLQKANLAVAQETQSVAARGAPGDRPPAAWLCRGGRRDPQGRRRRQAACASPRPSWPTFRPPPRRRSP